MSKSMGILKRVLQCGGILAILLAASSLPLFMGMSPGDAVMYGPKRTLSLFDFLATMGWFWKVAVVSLLVGLALLALAAVIPEKSHRDNPKQDSDEPFFRNLDLRE